jgi:endonuclease YncB( thermonuclease family)
MKIFLFYSLFLFSCTSNNNPLNKENTLSGKVVKVIDGDTFYLLKDDNTTIRVRMFGIDCPERRQDYYQVCKDALGSYIFGEYVTLVTKGKDGFRRTLATVFYQNENINLKMIQNGFAWHFKRYSSDPVMAEAENKARAAKIGLWKMDNVIAPWEYRSESRKR